MEGDTTDWVWPQQGAVGGQHTQFYQEHCLCENEEVNIGIAVNSLALPVSFQVKLGQSALLSMK